MAHDHQVLVFPAWRDNPFLNLLALPALARGRKFLGATTYASLLLQSERLSAGDALHVHWTSPLLQEVLAESEAMSRNDSLGRMLAGLRARGVALIWTVHNKLPHELRHRSAEIALYRLLVEHATVVHVMAPATPALMRDVVELPHDKVRVIPHPSYEGLYDTAIGRVRARDSFGLVRQDRAVLFLGQIRPYKGVDSLIEGASVAAQEDHDLVLMLAGVVKEMSLEDFEATIPDSLRSISSFSFVDDGDIDRWFTASDVVVLPYRAILNSGSLHLAATFRRPVIIPDEVHLREQFGDQAWVAFFDPGRAVDSIAELLADRSLFASVTDDDFARFTDPISPWEVGRRYADLLDEITAGDR